MEGRKRREIAGVDRGRTNAASEIAGKLGPKSRLERQILARDHQTGVRQERPGLGHVVGQILGAGAPDQDRSLMLAHHETVRHQVVQGVVKAGDLRGRPVAGAGHLVLLALHDRARRGLGEEGEGLGGDEGEAGRQQTIPQAWTRHSRIFLDPKDPGVALVGDIADF